MGIIYTKLAYDDIDTSRQLPKYIPPSKKANILRKRNKRYKSDIVDIDVPKKILVKPFKCKQHGYVNDPYSQFIIKLSRNGKKLDIPFHIANMYNRKYYKNKNFTNYIKIIEDAIYDTIDIRICGINNTNSIDPYPDLYNLSERIWISHILIIKDHDYSRN